MAFTRIETFNGPFVDGLNWDYHSTVVEGICEQNNNRLYLYIPMNAYGGQGQVLTSKLESIVIGPDNNTVIAEIDWDLGTTGKKFIFELYGNPVQHLHNIVYHSQITMEYVSPRSIYTPGYTSKIYIGIFGGDEDWSEVWLDTQTSPNSGKFKIEISGGYAKSYLDEGWGYRLVHQAPQRINTTDPYYACLGHHCLWQEESGIYLANFKYSVSPNISEAGKVRITASIAGGKYADAYVYTNNPCQCPLEMNIGIDNETLDLYDGPRQSKIVIAAERAGYPALEIPVQCINYTAEAGSLQWEWRYLGIDYIDSEKTTAVNEVAGVSQCRVDHFIESVSTVYIEAPDGTPMLVYGNLYAGHNEKTIDLSMAVATGFKLQVSYWAQGIAINYFNALAVGSASLEIKAETGKENPRYLLDTKTITVTDTTPAPPTVVGGGTSSGGGSVVGIPGTAPTVTITGPASITTYSYLDTVWGPYRLNTSSTSYSWSVSGAGWSLLSHNNQSPNNTSPVGSSDWCYLWVDGFHGGTVTLTCTYKDSSGVNTSVNLTITKTLGFRS